MTSQDRSAHLNNTTTAADVVATVDNASIHVTIQHGQTTPVVTSPEPPRPPRIDITSLPNTSSLLFGREAELAELDAAWLDDRIHVVTLVAWGGVGKSALVNAWLAGLCGESDCRGAERIFGWSFYSQGAAEGRQASLHG